MTKGLMLSCNLPSAKLIGAPYFVPSFKTIRAEEVISIKSETISFDTSPIVINFRRAGN